MKDVCPFVYRAAVKLLSLQRLCNMDVVLVPHIMAAFQEEGGANLTQDIMMDRDAVGRVVDRMFVRTSQEVAGCVRAGGAEEACSLMFRLLESNQTGCVSSRSLQTALIALSADNLLAKYTSLVRVSGNTAGSVNRSGLRSLLQDLSQVPAVVQEDGVFGSVEAAVSSCFKEVPALTVSEEHMLSWLQGEPRLLLWLPTLYRLSVSQKISHAVRCHTCKTFPIVGLRYRCKKCVNVHVCQNCFLTNRQTRRHRVHHPVVEFCTQPTWRESLSSLVRNARHALLPRRHTQREAFRTVLKWVEPGETQNRAPPPSNASTLLDDLAQIASSEEAVSHDASALAPPPSCSSKSLQTDEELQSRQVVVGPELLTEVRNLQRDKWLLEQQLQAWRLTVQSEQGVLENRCAEMEVTMDMLRQHNDRLQGMLAQIGRWSEHLDWDSSVPEGHSQQDVLLVNEKQPRQQRCKGIQAVNKMEAQQYANNTPLSFNTDHADGETSDAASTSEEELKESEWSQSVLQTPSPTIQQDATLSHDLSEEEEPAMMCHNQPIEQQGWPEGAGFKREDAVLSKEKDCGKCSPEQLLQETVARLKTEMDNTLADKWTGKRWEAEPLEAAEQVGDSVRHLVDSLRTNRRHRFRL